MLKDKKISVYAIDKKNSWQLIDLEEEKNVEAYTNTYIQFLTNVKTERLAHSFIINEVEEKGYRNIDTYHSGNKLQPGDTVYRSYGGRTLLLAKIGKKPLVEGLRIIGSHLDAPRLDSKPNPLYEDSELVLLDTHYYGGIKKYQWVTLPLAIHGIVMKENGEEVQVHIGDKPEDPVFTITDVLPHLGKEQAKKSLAEGVSGESLNVLIASKPIKDNDLQNKVKEQILQILYEQYGIKEEDLNSADLEIVPAGAARELGLDRSMIIGYGQDDRICSYAAYKALLDIEDIPEYTSVVLLCDKEEIGSVGATGMDSTFFENSIAELLYHREEEYSELMLRRLLERSKMISADVSAVHDPNYPDVSAPNGNRAYLNYGLVISKYTGSRGKAGASEASAEFMAEIRKIFNQAGVSWQSAELGKVDGGGGGTIALFMARYGINVVDCGPGLLSMHAPWEVSSKVDAYMAYKGYKAFLEYKG